MSALARAVRSMILRGSITEEGESGGRLRAGVSILAGFARAGVEVVQQYGFASRPPVGAGAVVLMVGGAPDHAVIVATDAANTRPALAAGDSAQHDSRGQVVHLRAAGVLVDGVQIKLGIAAAQGVARVGDSVIVTLGKPEIVGITAAQAAILAGQPVVPVPVSGTITAGSTKVLSE